MMSKIYADNLARSSSDSSRGIAGRVVAMQATGRDLSKINCHCCNKFGHYKNDCAVFNAAHHQNRRDNGITSSEADISRISRSWADSSGRGEGGKCGAYITRPPHNDADCRATPANGFTGNAHFAQVRPPSVPGICSSWDLPVKDDSTEKPYISFLANEVQPAAKPAKARVEGKKGARPFGSVSTAATEMWKVRPWPFTPRVELQPAIKPAKARVEEKGARPFGPVSTAATEGWRTRPLAIYSAG